MLRRASLLLPMCLGCSLFCPINGAQPCDETGSCLPGYACVSGLCVASASGDGGSSGGSGGCSSSTQCPQGACDDGFCANVPIAWTDAGPSAAAMTCFPWPPPASAGNPTVTLTGCIDLFPVDPETSSPDAGSVQLFEDGFALGSPALLLPEPTCAGGLGYRVQAPPGQVLNVAVGSPPVWAEDAFQEGVVASADGGRRDLGAISIQGWSAEADGISKALGLTSKPTDGLVLGTVRDCAGRPLSGVSVSAGDAGLVFAYLDGDGNALTRTATGTAGRFGTVWPAGSYTLSFLAEPAQGAAPEVIAALPVSLEPGGTAFVDVAPAGP